MPTFDTDRYKITTAPGGLWVVVDKSGFDRFFGGREVSAPMTYAEARAEAGRLNERDRGLRSS